jgi:hypothetical protein
MLHLAATLVAMLMAAGAAMRVLIHRVVCSIIQPTTATL